MNDFLDRHGYRIYQGDSFLMIRHYNRTNGCVHAIFIFIIFSLAVISALFVVFAQSYTMGIITILAVAVYIFEMERRRKDVKQLFLEVPKRRFRIRKGKTDQTYPFDQVMQVVSTSEHLGGYASSDRDSTEEYKREINVLFKDGQVLTAFSFISDAEEPEKETLSLIDWLKALTDRS
ncbi:hypothetical protein [Reichenbachiella ulvae]|uniref:YcxB-like protein n=1 Tax=Reichenbachiella ulvae TaxID=2980104 RepID=A0ABT3CXL4_9BACT|nr:hypothetical protein [Reichenbachiella ulvae]MCV9388446.1 hypothetical protein [Reichenbachiella ulvae]